MSTSTTSTNTESSVRPDYSVYTQASDNAPLVRVGAAWKHRKGEGLNIRLDAIPLNGSLVLFPPREDSER